MRASYCGHRSKACKANLKHLVNGNNLNVENDGMPHVLNLLRSDYPVPEGKTLILGVFAALAYYQRSAVVVVNCKWILILAKSALLICGPI